MTNNAIVSILPVAVEDRRFWPHPTTATLEQQRQQRFADLVAWLAAQGPTRTPSATVHAASTKDKYKGAELSAAPTRPGADKARSIPSRMGDRLHHLCSRTTDLAGNPCAISIGLSHD